MNKDYDVIVVGVGYVGVEVVLVSVRFGNKIVFIILYLDIILMMFCNFLIGGLGKSNFVIEIDVFGGEMGRYIDEFNF